MMIDVVVYASSVANAHKHARKVACLENFAQGVRATGSSVVGDWDYRYTPSKLAVMLDGQLLTLVVKISHCVNK